LGDAERTRLEELYLSVVEEHSAVRLLLGQNEDLVAELRQLVRCHPFRERFWLLLMVALGQVSRRAEALTAFHDVRSLLREHLGIEPGRDLQEQYVRLLDTRPVRLTPWWADTDQAPTDTWHHKEAA
jgi:DNA-binding SARP family transcriptional activator